MTNSIQFIDGCWEAGEGQLFKSIDPARNEAIWSGESASEAQVEKAVMAARKAFPDWAGRSVEERLAICKKFSALLEENKEHLAQVMAKETGKPVWETRTEVGAMMGKVAISERAYHERT
ncbi:aldehyde dehydrogenase family protein, partial [Idiomarina abyssalis]|uniref:aldehyde dehydrogenase family protein n=3 Tax=Idiomarinaceae TaxID=267893 RepID=UPI00241FE71C